ncbi:hypothetical protein F5877DRAFT_68975 [Lentinula edodes]|nr:hypothetical protein F5877DRAFT_68975 [Lentinula edodes]
MHSLLKLSGCGNRDVATIGSHGKRHNCPSARKDQRWMRWDMHCSTACHGSSRASTRRTFPNVIWLEVVGDARRRRHLMGCKDVARPISNQSGTMLEVGIGNLAILLVSVINLQPADAAQYAMFSNNPMVSSGEEKCRRNDYMIIQELDVVSRGYPTTHFNHQHRHVSNFEIGYQPRGWGRELEKYVIRNTHKSAETVVQYNE